MLTRILLPIRTMNSGMFRRIYLKMAIFHNHRTGKTTFTRITTSIRFRGTPFSHLRISSVISTRVIRQPRDTPSFPSIANSILLRVLGKSRLMTRVIIRFRIFHSSTTQFIKFQLRVSRSSKIFPTRCKGNSIGTFTMLFRRRFIPFFRRTPNT